MPGYTPRRVSPYVLLGVASLVAIAVALAGMAFWPGSSDPPRSPQAASTAVPLRDPHALTGRTIVLDPGHNGGNGAAGSAINRLVDAGGFQKECDTAGAETDAGYPEHAFTFDVATRAAGLLRSRGATVILTRDDDTGVGPCVDERARIGNAAGAEAVVSIHADGGPPEGSGFHVIAPAASPDGGNGGILTASARLADLLRGSFGAATGQRRADYLGDDGITVRSDLGGLNLSRVPKVFLECGNMHNPGDAGRISDAAWRQRAAEGIVDGLAAFLVSAPSGGPSGAPTGVAGPATG
ncbi:cell wall hydrolase [Parafrankia soli]|uniref:Cell wall hydrolase n=1 Tax=Parafrankia soli TaxID=2599596 RepID=A0A1S1QWB3_9ACTN|nr:N-acetylmuramoyl-L-alanine amidase [Parafrankia soli]OHV37332.1 cell wall hydrolase [Parafrankia soli]